MLGYLLEKTRLDLKTVYIETPPVVARNPGSPRARKKRRWYNSWSLLCGHARLSSMLPRYYAFKAAQLAFGIDELSFLYWCERQSPHLFRRACGFTLPEELNGRGVLRRFDDVIRRYDLSVKTVGNFNSQEALVSMRQDQCDVALGLGTRILSQHVLETPRLGVLNAHSSLLPDYRGGTTEFWQLVSGEKRTGVTIHWMAPSVDEGPIFAQRSWVIPPHSDHHRLRLMSLFYRLDLWREVIARLNSGEAARELQPSARTTTFRHPTLEQQTAFYCRARQGLSLTPQIASRA